VLPLVRPGARRPRDGQIVAHLLPLFWAKRLDAITKPDVVGLFDPVAERSLASLNPSHVAAQIVLQLAQHVEPEISQAPLKRHKTNPLKHDVAPRVGQHFLLARSSRTSRAASITMGAFQH